MTCRHGNPSMNRRLPPLRASDKSARVRIASNVTPPCIHVTRFTKSVQAFNISQGRARDNSRDETRSCGTYNDKTHHVIVPNCSPQHHERHAPHATERQIWFCFRQNQVTSGTAGDDFCKMRKALRHSASPSSLACSW